MRRSIRIVIIGAGIGGLTAACALRLKGFSVELYERAAELGEVGAGLQLAPNAVKVLRGLGLEKALRPLAFEPTNIVSLSWNDATLRFREALKGVAAARFGAPYLTMHRADLHRLLCGQIPSGSIHLDACCTGVTQDRDRAVATFADGSTAEADILIGADGIRSIVRESIFGLQPARFTQQIAWRCMVPIGEVPVAVGSGGSVRVERDEYVGWIGPNGHVICYPIRGGELYNIFAGHVSEQWAEESWITPSTTEELLDAYAGWHDALLSMLAKSGRSFKWGIYDRDPLPHWVRGRIALLGDAAHPMMPTLAQGAAIAMEDGVVLARRLGQHDDPRDALRAYEEERMPRAGKVQLQARQQFENNRKAPPPPPLSRDWIFAHDATGDVMASAQ